VANAEGAKPEHRCASVSIPALHESDLVVVLRIGPDITWDSRTRERIQLALDHGDRGIVICDVAAIQCPTLSMLDVLARLQLAVRRRGWYLTLRGAHSKLRVLLALAGLIEVLRVTPNAPGDPVDGG
jgi:hypothetical protein